MVLVTIGVIFLCAIFANSQVTINQNVLAIIDEHFIGAGEEMNDYLNNIDLLNNQHFRYLSSRLGPGVLRVGGITCDFVRYVVPGAEESADARPTASPWPRPIRDLPLNDFNTLIQYAKTSNLELLFDLNELYGRDCSKTLCTGNWDSSNARQFLKYIHDNNIGPIFGFELGNELTRYPHITITENINDYKQLNEIINSIWTSPQGRPPIFGPSTDICNSDVEEFMNQTKDFLHGFTYHSYPGNNGSQLHTQLLSIDWLKNNIILDDKHANSIQCIKTWAQIGKPVGMKLWVTETNSAYADTPGVMNGFLNGFWYLASLAQYAQTGVTLHSRWALHGGTFAFINSTSSLSVLPDYWIAVIHKKVIGNNVLSVNNVPNDVLLYAQCGQVRGSVVLLTINPNNYQKTINVRGVTTPVRDEYFLTAESLSSYVPNLNGVPLRLESNGVLPPLSPKRVNVGDLVLPPYSLGFVVYVNSGLSVCG